MSSARRDRLWLGGSFAAILALYWPAVAGQGAFYERDVWLYWLPHVEWVTRALASGALPQWIPYRAFGGPFLADPSFQFFYPPAALNWLLPPRLAYTVLVVGHSVFGALGMFRLLRPRIRSGPAAFVGAVVLVASGPVASAATLWHHFCSVMYLPWIVDAFLRLRSGRASSSRLGLLTGLQALAGSADACVMTGGALLFLLPLRLNRLRSLSPKLIKAVVLCFLIAAIQWLPTAVLLRSAVRGTADPESRLAWSVAPYTLTDLLIPLKGAAHADRKSGDFFDMRARFIGWFYLGASTLPLLVLGIRRSARFSLLLGAALILSLGKYTLIGEFAARLPLISAFRFPSKILWLVAFCWAVLVAIGLRDLADRGRRSAGGAVVGVLGIASAAIVFWTFGTGVGGDIEWRRAVGALLWAPLMLGTAACVSSFGRRSAWALAIVVAIDLVVAGRGYNIYAGQDLFMTRPTIVDDLRRLQARRIYVDQESRDEGLGWRTPPGWTDGESYYFGQSQYLYPPQGVRWSIPGSYDGDFSGLGDPAFVRLSVATRSGNPLLSPLLRASGVTHAIQFKGAVDPPLPVLAEIKTLHDRPVRVLGVPDPLPRAYVVPRVRHVESREDAIRILTSPSFDPTLEALRQDRETERTAGGQVESIGIVNGFREAVDGSVTLQASLASPGTLVVLSANASGWQARVDGHPTPVHTANVLFRSVDLDAGEHRVELRYQTPGLIAGFWLSLSGWFYLAWRVSARSVANRTAKRTRSMTVIPSPPTLPPEARTP